MSRPRLFDLFSGAGGATKGYQRAGFHVTGVDHVAQPNYCGDEFWESDVFDILVLGGVDAVHASPPCQHYANVTRWRGCADAHPDLVGPTRHLLEQTGKPWVIENVREAGLRDPIMLCGSQFGLPIRRHRYFESNVPLFELMPPCQHRGSDYSFDHGGKQPESVYRDAMGCHWMTVEESRQAIPPAYTEWIGTQLLAAIGAAA